jgi:hypothetical protein
MCEINPKRIRVFRLEFFSAHDLTDERWERLIYEKLIKLENEFNAPGEIRVHIHET